MRDRRRTPALGARQGLEIESEPREYDYSPGSYADVLYDADGINLEVVHIP